MSEQPKDPLGTAPDMEAFLNDALGTLGTNNTQNSGRIPELSANDKHCLDHIDSLRDESLKDRDHLTAVLGFLTAGNMELALRFASWVRELMSTRTGPLHELPEIHRMLATHSNLTRQYQRDVDLRWRYKHSTRQAAPNNGPLRSNAAINPAEKPR